MAQTTLTSYPSSSPSSTPRRLKYDVFLSFRGEDTRNNFTSHLNYALSQRGIQTFKDNQLIRGEEISPSLITAIRESKISIVIFSKNYASSAWCLDELVMILDCRESLGQLVWPVFLNVEPSHVRNQTGPFGDALLLYEALHDSNTSSKYKERLPKWKIALRKAGNLSGWHLNEGDESELIQRIVEATSSKLNRTPLYVAKYPVGIDARVQYLGSLANVGANDVRVIGIHGTGGIGKTTVAKAVFNKFADDFEGSSFLANVRETSQQYCGLVQLQETLLFDMLGDQNLKVGNTHRGINIIRDRLCHKRVLLVLDDVDQLDQLEALAGEHAWFGPGSRVIITTRNKHFLTTYGVDATYEVKGLNYYKALELLSWNAFKGNKPAKGYHELSQQVIKYANGIPLALVVLGSFLCSRSKHAWMSAIEEIERKPHKQVYEILKISFDALQDNVKTIFLDIACFFVGEHRDYVIKVLECFNLCPTIGIEVLVDMSLITIEEGRVKMHNLIQEVGWEIVRQESPEVGKRRRLWLTEDVFHVFLENMGTNAIEGIKLVLPEQKTLYLSSKAFKKMKRLRLLIFHNVILSTTIEYLPTELRFIDWPRYQFPTLPLNPGPKQLVILNMPNSHIQQLGEGFKNFENLKVVNLSSSKFLTEIPDLSTATKLESLSLGDCTNLVQIHDSVGSLNRLRILDLQFCDKLRILPSSLHSEYLETLNLTSCFSIERFPNINIEMKLLDKLCLSGTAIIELPSSIDKLVRLRSLNLACCGKLQHIPNSIYNLHQLDYFDLHGCSQLSKFPKYISLSNKNEMFPSLELLPDSSNLNLPFQKLKTLDLEDCNLSEADFLMPSNGFDNLQFLFLNGNKIVSLPSLKRFSNIMCICLNNCEFLRKIPKLPPKLWFLFASNCKSLLESHCNFLDKILRDKVSEFEFICPGRHIPHWFAKACEGDSIGFDVDSIKLKKIAGVIMCAVFELDCKNARHCDTNDACSFQLQLTNFGTRTSSSVTPFIYNFSVKPGHMYLHYLPFSDVYISFAPFETVSSNFGVSFSKRFVPQSTNRDLFISRCGVHIVWHEDEKKLPCPPPPSLYPASPLGKREKEQAKSVSSSNL